MQDIAQRRTQFNELFNSKLNIKAVNYKTASKKSPNEAFNLKEMYKWQVVDTIKVDKNAQKATKQPKVQEDVLHKTNKDKENNENLQQLQQTIYAYSYYYSHYYNHYLKQLFSKGVTSNKELFKYGTVANNLFTFARRSFGFLANT